MLVAACQRCSLVFRVLGDFQELETLVGRQSSFWPDKYICGRCQGPTPVMSEQQAARLQMLGQETVELDPGEYFRALQGLGLPDEIECGRTAVEQLLRGQKVKRIAGHEVNKRKRFCLEWIEFEDGSRAYFGASSHGAIVYKITKPPNYTARAMETSDELG